MVAALVLQAPGGASSLGSGSSRHDASSRREASSRRGERGVVAAPSLPAPAIVEHAGGDGVALLPLPALAGGRLPFAWVVEVGEAPLLPAALARLWLRDCRLLC